MGAPLGTWYTFLYLRDNIESQLVWAVLTTDTFQLSLCPTLGDPSTRVAGTLGKKDKTQKHQCCCLRVSEVQSPTTQKGPSHLDQGQSS